jgi:hypothetical protein
LRRHRALGSRLWRPDEKLSVDVSGQPLDGNQLATEFFKTVVVESKAELNSAIGDAALGD